MSDVGPPRTPKTWSDLNLRETSTSPGCLDLFQGGAANLIAVTGIQADCDLCWKTMAVIAARVKAAG
jgi:hypothetical protein